MWISGPSVQKSLQKSNFFSTSGAPAHENKKQKRKVNIAKKIKSQNPSCVAAPRRRRQIRTGRSATAEGAGTTTAGGVQGAPPLPGAALPLPTTFCLAAPPLDWGPRSLDPAGEGAVSRSRRARVSPRSGHCVAACRSHPFPARAVHHGSNLPLPLAAQRRRPLPSRARHHSASRHRCRVCSGPPPTVARCREKVSDESEWQRESEDKDEEVRDGERGWGWKF